MSKKPLPKMPKARPATTKPKAVAADKTAPVKGAKVHERKAKPSEAERLEKTRRLVAAYLVQRDGMDEEVARAVVDSMEADDVNTLLVEANTATMAATPAAAPVATPEAAAPVTAELPAPSDETAATLPTAEPIDFLSVPALADDDTFPEIVIRCRDAAATKNEAEKRYKADKKVLDAVMAEAGVDKNQPLMCAGIRLVRYTGKSPKQLSATKLMEKGVSIDVINQCFVQGEYDDVRITTPEVE